MASEAEVRAAVKAIHKNREVMELCQMTLENQLSKELIDTIARTALAAAEKVRENGYAFPLDQAGVNQIGKPLTVLSGGGTVDLVRGPVQRVSDRQTYQVLPSTLPGLSYVRTNSGGDKSYSLYHEGSGRIVGYWDSRREGPNWDGKKLDTAAVDANLCPLAIDWTSKDVESHPNFNGTKVRWALYGKPNT